MKWEKWHLGLITLIVIIGVSALVWHFKPSQSSSNSEEEVLGSTTEQDEQEIATESELIKALFFYSDGCSHCSKMKPIVEELQAEGYQIEWIDASQNRDLDNKFQIEAVPTFVRPDGERLVGGQTKEKLAEFLQEYKK